MINWLGMITAILTEKSLSVEQMIDTVRVTAAGAVSTFSGNVRDIHDGKRVLSLSYEIHPTAHIRLREIVEDVCSVFNVMHASVAHRFGQIPIGESALVVVISARHRYDAIECCSALVEKIKSGLPIWKFQEFADGTSEWVDGG